MHAGKTGLTSRVESSESVDPAWQAGWGGGQACSQTGRLPITGPIAPHHVLGAHFTPKYMQVFEV